MKNVITTCLVLLVAGAACAQSTVPEVLSIEEGTDRTYLPDFSYAGYHFGEKEIPSEFEHVLDITDFGAVANDDIDDSAAFVAVLEKADTLDGFVLIKIPSGTFNISKIIYINRSKTVLKGVGTGKGGTVFHFQRSLRFCETPPEHEELMEYLVRFDKRLRDPKKGIDARFSQYSWSGGFFWVAKKGKLYKSYNIPEYNQPVNKHANGFAGKQGAFEIEVDSASELKVGGVYKFCWFNKDGEDGSLLKHMYDHQDVTIGSHHWNNPESPLVSQMVLVTKIENNTVFIKDPLLYDVRSEWHCCFAEWEHIEEVGFENIAFEFPISPDLPHHLEEGNNALYLTSLMNGWVRNVRFLNADSGILTDDISNVTIENVRTHGEKKAHYSVATGEVHNVLIKNLKVENEVLHPLSFNTRSTKCVYTSCQVDKAAVLDQHSGTNAQNLFDDIKVYIDAPVHHSLRYPLFYTGGSPHWAPSHGAYNTFFNIDISFANIPEDRNKPIVLHGAKEGVSVRLIGIHANHPVAIEYEPNAYKELINEVPSIPSLYQYQLDRRLKDW